MTWEDIQQLMERNPLWAAADIQQMRCLDGERLSVIYVTELVLGMPPQAPRHDMNGHQARALVEQAPPGERAMPSGERGIIIDNKQQEILELCMAARHAQPCASCEALMATLPGERRFREGEPYLSVRSTT